jgi:hypothetical protein
VARTEDFNLGSNIGNRHGDEEEIQEGREEEGLLLGAEGKTGEETISRA